MPHFQPIKAGDLVVVWAPGRLALLTTASADQLDAQGLAAVRVQGRDEWVGRYFVEKVEIHPSARAAVERSSDAGD